MQGALARQGCTCVTSPLVSISNMISCSSNLPCVFFASAAEKPASVNTERGTLIALRRWVGSGATRPVLGGASGSSRRTRFDGRRGCAGLGYSPKDRCHRPLTPRVQSQVRCSNQGHFGPLDAQGFLALWHCDSVTVRRLTVVVTHAGA